MNVAAHMLDNSQLLLALQRVLYNSYAAAAAAIPTIAGVDLEQQQQIAHLLPTTRVPAAVLVPIIQRSAQLTVLLTERASHLKHHGGQISFPGGRIETADASPMQAALRETEEEIGLSREFAEVIGYLPQHLIFTGYCVTPVVALVNPDFSLQIDACEVASVFEVPLHFILDPANHQARERQIGDMKVRVYDLPYGERHIWGATAGILMNLYRLLNEDNQ